MVPRARAYSCGDGLDGGHCYGDYDWSGATTGSATSIYMVHLTCSTSCSSAHGFVDNEMWLIDENNPTEYWVESGYESYPPGSSSNDSYFWADERPNGGGYNFHDFGQVASGDYQHYTSFTIVKDGSQYWEVYLGTYTTDYVGYSTSNSMSPSDIVIGLELAGSGGGAAPVAYFNDNEWYDSTLHAHYQTYGSDSYPGLLSNNPPYASWYIHPQNSSTGGSLKTSCC